MDFLRLKEGLSKLRSKTLLRPMPRVLPPIGSASQQQQQQQQQQSGLLGASSSSCALPTPVDPALLEVFLGDRVPSGILKRGAPRPLCRKDLTGLDHSHPLKPLFNAGASRDAPSGSSTSSMAPAPPAVAKATSKSAAKPKPMKARRCQKLIHDVGLKPRSHLDDKNSSGENHDSCQANIMLEQDGDSRVKSLKILQDVKEWLKQEASRVAKEMELTDIESNRSASFAANTNLVDIRMPLLRISTPPTSPVPPQATKPQTSNSGQICSKLPHFRKTSAVSVVTAVEEQKSVESLAVRKEEERKVEEVKEIKKKEVRKAKQTRVRERQQAREKPGPARRPPVAHPEQTLQHALRLLSTEEWEKKVEALTSIRCLCEHHTEVLLPSLHDLCLAVTKEVKNLRSVVSRAAMVTLAHLFTNLGQGMDPEVEGAARALLQKAGEASSFIRQDAEMALSHMVLTVSPSRAVTALINTGLKHRCAAVRASAAQHLEALAEAVDSSYLLSGRSELTDRFVHAISCFALDSAQEVRTHARNTLAILASHPDLIKMVDKFAPRRDQNDIKDIIDKCQHSNVR